MKKLLKFICNPVNKFEKTVLHMSKSIGMDGAMYVVIGIMEDNSNNYATDTATDDQMENLVSAIIKKFPALEF